MFGEDYDSYDEEFDVDMEDVDSTNTPEFDEIESFDQWSAEDQDVLLAMSAVHMLETADMEGLDADEEFTLDDLEDMVEQGEISEKYAHYVAESTRNVVKLSKESKFAALARRAIMMLAKKANDAEYKKYSKYRKLMKESEKKLMKKYGGSKAKSFARKMITNAKKAKQSSGTKKAVKHLASTLKSDKPLKGGKTGTRSRGSAGNRFNVSKG